MPSIGKPASSKRAPPPRLFSYARSFSRDWERLGRSGRFDMVRLKQVMLLVIANDGPLPAEWKDHELKGEWSDHRECHVGGDFLLIYLIDGTDVVFVRAGTHAELLE